MKPLSLEKTRLKEEMKERCLNKGQYVDENAKAKFDMLCHLEDFEVGYWELERENQELKNSINALQKELNEENFQCSKYAIENQLLKKQLEELKSTNKVLSEELTKDKILKQDCLTTCCGIPIGDIPKLINQQKEFIEYLEEEMKKNINWYNSLTPHDKNYYYKDYVDKDTNYMVVLSKYKEIIGDDK